LKCLQADASLRSVPILLMSPAADPDLLDGRFDAFVAKPFDLYHVLALVKELLNGRADYY